MMRNPRLLLASIVALAASLAPQTGLAAEGSFERTLKVTAPVELEISTGSGNINVRAGDASTVRIHGAIRSSSGWHLSGDDAERKVRYLESNPPIEQSGNFIRVGHISDHSLTRNISINYDVIVPRDTRLRSETGSGSLEIEGVRGPVKAATGSGNLKIEDISDELHAETGSGGINIREVKGQVYASTGSGSIHATGVGGSFVAKTGSGDVRLEQTRPGDGKVETGSGTVELRGLSGALRVQTGSGSITADGDPRGNWNLETASGNVTVRLPAEAAFRLDARTSSGSISSQRSITTSGTIRRGELHGQVGQGGSRIELGTASGNIQID